MPPSGDHAGRSWRARLRARRLAPYPHALGIVVVPDATPRVLIFGWALQDDPSVYGFRVLKRPVATLAPPERGAGTD